jgi:hypothetical protein
VSPGNLRCAKRGSKYRKYRAQRRAALYFTNSIHLIKSHIATPSITSPVDLFSNQKQTETHLRPRPVQFPTALPLFDTITAC